MSLQEKDQARGELREVEGRLQVIAGSLQSLYEEKSRLEQRRKALEQILRRPVQEDKDWSAAFPWYVDATKLWPNT